MAANTNAMSSERRRKRRSSTRQEAKTPSLSSTAVVLALLFLASVPLDVFNTGWLLSATERDDTASRRFLRSDQGRGGEEVLDVGLGENVWKRPSGASPKGVARRMADEVAGEGRRMPLIPRYADKHHFDECVGKTVAECQVLVDAYVTAHPEQFNNQTTLWLDVRKIREWIDDSYYKVVLRTNLAGDEVWGILDDGMVHYPWPWRVEGEDRDIGPWDCSGNSNSNSDNRSENGEINGNSNNGGSNAGGFLSPAECCRMIQAEIKWRDDNGRYLACYVEEPVGGVRNPERDDRAIVVIDGAGTVVRSPVAH